jgi:hypothetical protein
MMLQRLPQFLARGGFNDFRQRFGNAAFRIIHVRQFVEEQILQCFHPTVNG